MNHPSLRRISPVLAVLSAGAVIVAGCGGSSPAETTGAATTTPAQRQAATEGGSCRPDGAVTGGGFSNKYRCVVFAKRGKWQIIEYGSPVPKQPGLLPEGTWQCVSSGENPIRTSMVVRGDVYTIRVGQTKYPHQRYGEGSASTPRGGTALKMGSAGAFGGNVGEYVRAGSATAVNGKDTLWTGKEQSWPEGGWTCTK